MTLSQWLEQFPDQPYVIGSQTPNVGIHDVQNIKDLRSGLWDLKDYRVSAVQAGVIWLIPVYSSEEKR